MNALCRPLEGSGKVPILGECFLTLNLLNTWPLSSGLNSSRANPANAVQDDLTSAGGLTQQLLCAQERTKSSFLFPKTRRSN